MYISIIFKNFLKYFFILFYQYIAKNEKIWYNIKALFVFNEKEYRYAGKT